MERNHLRTSRYLFSHLRYYVREMRIIAYAQLLESYRSLTMESMANAFGVSEEFIDKQISYLYFYFNPSHPEYTYKSNF